MIPIERIISKVVELRSECAARALGSPARENPELEYGEAIGRDTAFGLVLEAIQEMIEEANREEREED